MVTDEFKILEERENPAKSETDHGASKSNGDGIEGEKGSFKNKYWKFVGGFLILIVLAIIGMVVYNKYFSEQARYDREVEKNYQAYLDFEDKYQEAMRNDIYGGKTPEETLAMFVEALKKEDVELASKYFVLRDDGSIDPKWVEGLRKTKEAGQLSKIVETIPKMSYDDDVSWEDTAWFSVVNSKGEAEYTVILTKNKKYSDLWKIESL